MSMQKRKWLKIFILIIIICILLNLFMIIIFKRVIYPNPYATYKEGYPPYKEHYKGSGFFVRGVACYTGNDYILGFYKDLSDIDRPGCSSPESRCSSEIKCYGAKYNKEYDNHIQFYNMISEEDVDFYIYSKITSCLGISKIRRVCLIG